MPCDSGTHIEQTWLPTMQIDVGLKDQFLMAPYSAGKQNKGTFELRLTVLGPLVPL